MSQVREAFASLRAGLLACPPLGDREGAHALACEPLPVITAENAVAFVCRVRRVMGDAAGWAKTPQIAAALEWLYRSAPGR